MGSSPYMLLKEEIFGVDISAKTYWTKTEKDIYKRYKILLEYVTKVIKDRIDERTPET